MIRCLSSSLAAMVAIICLSPSASADFPKNIKTLGKVHSFNTEQLNVVTVANEGWVFKLNEKSVVSYKAEGGPELMIPKLAVKFRCKIDNRGNIVEPVDTIIVFTPKQFFQPVIDVAPPEEDLSENGDQKEAEAPEPAAESFDAALADAEEPVGQPSRNGGAQTDTDDGVEYQVIGALVSYRRGKMVVDCGEAGKLRGELSEDAAVTVELEGLPALKAAKAGDTVYAEGYSGTPGQANARKVEITMGPPEEDKKRSKPSRTSDKSGKAGEPAVENPGFAE